MTPSGELLHVVVGHELRPYFLNAVRSVRALAPGDRVLVVDNASHDQLLRAELAALAAEDPKVELIRREENDLRTNAKVGGLYDAYREAFARAAELGYRYVHLLQGDMQLLWWDDDVLARARAIFGEQPACADVLTCLQPMLRTYGGELVPATGSAPFRLAHYGVADTGIFDLHRWQRAGLGFSTSERAHGARWMEAGFAVFCHPWPTVAPIPWPAVVRGGRRIGRIATSGAPFLLRPLSGGEVRALKQRQWSWMEDLCTPWGWRALSPMWATDLASADYLAGLRHHLADRGVGRGRPRWAGVPAPGGAGPMPRRPSLLRLCVAVPLAEAGRRAPRGRLGGSLQRLAGG
jgi:hypothetical protein